jgi:EAL domain-containing protein (putative c-di-GMP-specific phosphodiesterase class I)
MVRALREDIMADRIHVAWQPKVDLVTGRLVGLEALARWNGPDGQPVPPAVFIPMAERNGLIADLGNRVLERVLRELAAWRTEGLRLVPVAINVSAPQFQRGDMALRLQNALLRHRLPASLIEIELTESILMNDFASTLATLHALRAVGVGLSIDDFGTGYSSLAYLRCFPVQSLKLDRSFVSDLAHDARTREIVDAVIALAHKFDVRCIAEGVESAEQVDALRQMGCDQAQGFRFDRPLNALEVRSRLADGYGWD